MKRETSGVDERMVARDRRATPPNKSKSKIKNKSKNKIKS